MSLQSQARQDSSVQSSDSKAKFTSMGKRSQSQTFKIVKKPDNRCLQNNLVYCINMPLWFEDQNVMNNKLFFGRYGKITSVIPTLIDSAKTKIPNSKYIQAYITYQNYKDAALAIAATNQIKYIFRVLRTTFGTNRLCNHYLNGQKCKVRNCFYLHEQKSCIKIQGPLVTNFQRQKNIAYDIIKKNIPYYVDKIDQQKGNGEISRRIYQDKGQSFPSIKEVIENLVQKGIISKISYQNALKQKIASKKKMSQTIKKIQYIRYKSKSTLQPKALVPTLQNQNQPKNQLQNQFKTYNDNKKVTKNKIYVPKQSKKSQPNNLDNCQFLMKNILQSLDNEPSSRFNNLNLRENYSYDINWNYYNPFGVPILSDFYNQKDCWEKQLLQTQESQTSLTQPYYDTAYQKQNEQDGQQSQLVNKVKKQIMKKRVKVSKLQFTLSTPFPTNFNEYQKVTKLLQKELIR